MEFLAPDARALLSSAFLRDHCFGVAEDDRNRSEQVGLTFEPVRGRQRDIAGTLWLDAGSFELLKLEFHWLDLPLTMRHERLGGDVHFLRLPDGTWVVLRTRQGFAFHRAADLLAGHWTDAGRVDLTPLGEAQGEGIAMAADGTVYVTGEGGRKAQPGTFATYRCAVSSQDRRPRQ